MSVVEKSIGELLVDNGQISADELRLAEREAKSTGEPLSLILSRLGLAYEHHFKNALELKYGVTYVSLARTEIQPEILKIVPEAKIREHMMVPVNEKGSRITVVMVNPEHTSGLAALKTYFGDRQFTPVVCTEDDFILFMSNLYRDQLEAKPSANETNGAKEETAKKDDAPAEAKAEAPVEVKDEGKPALSPLAAFLAKGKAELDALATVDATSKAEADAASKAEADAAAKAKAESEAAAKAEAEAAAKAKAESEAAAKAEAEAREKVEQEKKEKELAEKEEAEKEKLDRERAEKEKALAKAEPEIVVKSDLDSAYKTQLENMFKSEPDIPTNDETGKFDLNMLQKHIEETRNKANKKPAESAAKSLTDETEPQAPTVDKDKAPEKAEEKPDESKAQTSIPQTKPEPVEEKEKQEQAIETRPEQPSEKTAEVKPEGKAEIKPETETKLENEIKPENATKVEAEIKAETDMKADIEKKADTEKKAETETKPEPKAEAKRESRPDARDVARELAKELAEETRRPGEKDDEATGEFDALVSPTVEKKQPAQESKTETKEETKEETKPAPETENEPEQSKKEESKPDSQEKTTEVKLDHVGEEFKAITPKTSGEGALGECEPVASESVARPSAPDQKQHEALEKESDDAAVIMLCNQILANGIAKGASTIHVEAVDKQVLVHYRIQGQLMIVRKLPKMLMPALTQRFRKMGRVDQQDRRLPQDGRVKVRMSGKDFNLRLTVVPHTAGGEHIIVWIE